MKYIFTTTMFLLISTPQIFSQQSQAALEKKQAMISILQEYFPDKSTKEYNLESYNEQELLAIELEPYAICIEHLVEQRAKIEAQNKGLAPIRIGIRQAIENGDDEEYFRLLKALEEKKKTHKDIPFVDLTDEKGQHCQQLFEVNRRVMERQAAEEKHK